MNPAELRRLLELAAKAYGGVKYESYDGWVHTGEHGEEFRGKRWEPEDDDGDSRRLEVACGMNVYQGYGKATAECISEDEGGPIHATEPHGDNPCAATRLAVLRAAAAIGESMP